MFGGGYASWNKLQICTKRVGENFCKQDSNEATCILYGRNRANPEYFDQTKEPKYNTL